MAFSSVQKHGLCQNDKRRSSPGNQDLHQNEACHEVYSRASVLFFRRSKFSSSLPLPLSTLLKRSHSFSPCRWRALAHSSRHCIHLCTVFALLTPGTKFLWKISSHYYICTLNGLTGPISSWSIQGLLWHPPHLPLPCPLSTSIWPRGSTWERRTDTRWRPRERSCVLVGVWVSAQFGALAH